MRANKRKATYLFRRVHGETKKEEHLKSCSHCARTCIEQGTAVLPAGRWVRLSNDWYQQRQGLPSEENTDCELCSREY